MNDIVDHGVRFGRIAAMLPVRDMATAHDFYTKILGFTKTFENGTPVGFMILKRGDAELHLTPQPKHKAAPFDVAHLLVDNIDTLHALRQRHGLRVLKSLKDKDNGPKAFVFADPDRNRLDVGQRN